MSIKPRAVSFSLLLALAAVHSHANAASPDPMEGLQKSSVESGRADQRSAVTHPEADGTTRAAGGASDRGTQPAERDAGPTSPAYSPAAVMVLSEFKKEFLRSRHVPDGSTEKREAEDRYKALQVQLSELRSAGALITPNASVALIKYEDALRLSQGITYFHDSTSYRPGAEEEWADFERGLLMSDFRRLEVDPTFAIPIQETFQRWMTNEEICQQDLGWYPQSENHKHPAWVAGSMASLYRQQFNTQLVAGQRLFSSTAEARSAFGQARAALVAAPPRSPEWAIAKHRLDAYGAELTRWLGKWVDTRMVGGKLVDTPNP